MKKWLLLALALAWATPSHAYLVQANLRGYGTNGIIKLIDFTAVVTYETTTNTVAALSLNFDDPLGYYRDEPDVYTGPLLPNTISGPLNITSSSIILTNDPGLDDYEFTINTENGPFFASISRVTAYSNQHSLFLYD